jgi:alanyl-tRNA synthetase
MISKKDLKEKFSKDWEKYYKINFLLEGGFKRKTCKKCGKGFWTLDPKREVCDDQPCSNYTFIGNPPTKKKLDLIETWKKIEKFFVDNGHQSIKRYPTVCRWYPLFFTSAGIIDFYRLTNGNVTFDFPANPVFVNQPCLRFNDIENVGRTGKHYTCFTMVQQSSLFTGKEGYWKEKCIELDFNLLTQVFGIKPEEITFLESVWVGPNAFGSSLEYFVRGLELGNAVFTEFLTTNSGTEEMKEKIIDMGAGLERFAWITQGTPTSYDVSFAPVLEKLKKRIGIEYDKEFFLKYSKLAGILNLDEVENIELAKKNIAEKLGISVEELKKKTEEVEALYSLCDHALALTFAISDRALPSNVGGGYNLRIVLRRALSFIDKFQWDLNLEEICELHAKHLKPVCPELLEHQEEIKKILGVEEKRYRESKKRAKKIVKKIVETKEKLDESKLIQLYDSEGITPELLKESGVEIEIPPDFYFGVIERHMQEKTVEEKPRFDISSLPETKTLFYDDIFKFKAKVLKVFDENWIVLDQTAFYAEAGGQLSDKGFINGIKVKNVQKIGEVIIHELESKIEEGKEVECEVDKKRREILKQHHTSTHIINASARKVLGPWVWQHSAFKDVDKARLDITHFESLSEEEIEKIEDEANEIVEKELPVKTEVLPRGEAEQKYGFGIYQGGAVPSKKLRIVSIGDIDNEACGGTHCKSTGEVGSIKILRTKRIQDGVDRIEFASGDIVLNYLREKEKILKEVADKLKVKEEKVPEEVKKLFETWKKLRKKLRKKK